LAERVAVFDQYELSTKLLHDVRAVILTMHQDQRWLHSRRHILKQFIDGGGTLVVQGQVAYPFAGGLSRFRPAANLRLPDYAIELHRDHQVFDGVDPVTLNRRRGVAGFYAHGSNPPPPEATVVSSMAGGRLAVDWEVNVGKGRLFVHSGNDLWTTFSDTSANREFARRLVQWAITSEATT
jgi:hypothetical protein